MDDRSAIASNEASRLNEYVCEPDRAACSACDEAFPVADLDEDGRCEGCQPSDEPDYDGETEAERGMRSYEGKYSVGGTHARR